MMTHRFAGPDGNTRYEVAILVFFAMLTFRVCALPALLATTAQESMVYVIALGMALDSVLIALCLGVSRRGGLQRAPLHPALRTALGVTTGLVCLLKLVVYTVETVTYCVGDLFDEASALPLAAVLLLLVALLSRKGFGGIGRTALVSSGVVLVLLILTFALTTYNGYGYNLWVLLHPHGVMPAFWRSVLWMGDGVYFLFVDTSSDVRRVADYRVVRLGLLVAWATAIAFFALFLYTYGSALSGVRFAFARMFVSSNPESLGAVNWPVLLLWLMGVTAHLACLARGAVCGLGTPVPLKWHPWLTVVVWGAALAGYVILSRDKDGLTRLSDALWLNILVFSLLVILPLSALLLPKLRPDQDAPIVP